MNKKDLTKKVILYSLVINLTLLSAGCAKTSSKKEDADVFSKEPSIETSVTKDEMEDTGNYEYQEDDVIDEIKTNSSKIVDDFKKLSENELDKTKESFIVLVDFVFYDTVICDHTFDELTDEGKKEVLELLYNMDKKLNNTMPGYKSDIIEFSGEASTMFSEYLKKGKDNLSLFAEENIDKDTLDNMKETTDSIKKSFKEVIDSGIIEEKTDEVINGIDSWYSEFKGR